MNVKQLRAMLEDLPDENKIVVATDTDCHLITGFWFQDGLVICVAPTLSPEVTFNNSVLSKEKRR